MADDGERKLFGDVVRNKTKYGTTTNPAPKYVRYVKHNVSRVDTLQGIALKYAATVEQIKRENKLWTNDSLFLREFLYIPVTAENSHLVQDNWELCSSDEVRSRSNSELLTSTGAEGRAPMDNNGATRSDNDTKDSINANVNNGAKSDSGNKNNSSMDFFSKYDSSIAVLKSKVEKMEKDSSRDDNLSSLIPSATRRHSDYTRASRATPPRRISLETDEPGSPVLIITSNMRSTKVQSAVKRSKQANDDLFEL